MTIRLAEGFSQETEATWAEAARAALKGAPLEKLKTPTEDGFSLEPLYMRLPQPFCHAPPGAPPYRRGDRVGGAWAVRQPFADPDLDRANTAVLRDLERGVTELLLVLDLAGRRGLDPDQLEAQDLAGRGGLPIASVDDLDLVLAGVLDDLAPVVLDGGVAPLAQASLLLALWKRRGRDLAAIEGSLGAAPLSAWAAEGILPGGPARALDDVAALARWCGRNAPRVRVARADEGPFHEAGANDSLGLGLVLAEAAEHLRAFARGGHPLEQGAGQIELDLRVGSDVFAGAAKVRAARLAWSRLAEAVGLSPRAARPTLVARLGRRALSRDDPWVNLLRGTAATFAAGVGGAHAMVLEPFDAACGVPDELGRRLARNTQVILQEESHLSRVADPAGGSWYVEHRTERLAEAAWSVLREVEAQGGLAAALASGFVADKIAAAREARDAAIDRRKRPLTGVSEFPDPSESPLLRPERDPDAIEKAIRRLAPSRHRRPTLSPDDLGPDRVSGAIDAAFGGATLGLLQAALHPSADPNPIPRLSPRRLSERFEPLRARVREAAPPPIFLANIGPLAGHGARATFVQNLVGVAGFRVAAGPPNASPSEIAAAFSASGARVAVLCGTDADYATQAVAVAEALRGARRVVLAGRPGGLEAALEAAGVRGHVALGIDIRAALLDLLDAHDLPTGDLR